MRMLMYLSYPLSILIIHSSIFDILTKVMPPVLIGYNPRENYRYITNLTINKYHSEIGQNNMLNLTPYTNEGRPYRL